MREPHRDHLVGDLEGVREHAREGGALLARDVHGLRRLAALRRNLVDLRSTRTVRREVNRLAVGRPGIVRRGAPYRGE